MRENNYSRFYITSGVFISITIWIRLLNNLFPYTGFGAIITIPLIFFFIFFILFCTYKLTKHICTKNIFTINIIVGLLLILFSTAVYPQDGRTSPFNQISNAVKAIMNYEKSTIKDLNLPYEQREASDYEERYIVALYKFQNEVLEDSSYNLYREYKANIIETTYDPKIKSKDEIYQKLKTGKDKAIWWVLTKLKLQK
jgi:hypothetical protein